MINWKQMTIEEAAEFTSKPRGLNYASFQQIPFVPMEKVPTYGTYIKELIWKSGDAVHSGNYFEKGDCLLAKITPCFENGKQGITRALPADFGVASTELIPFRGRAGISNKYFLFFYFLDGATRQQIAQKMEGATGRQRIPISVLKGWPISLPPLLEQRKIAAILLKLQHAIETQDNIIKSLRDLKKSTMQHLFAHGLRGEKTKITEIGEIPDSWKIVKLRKMGRVGNGSTPKKSNRSYWEGGAIPWLTSGKIHDGIIERPEQFVTPEAKEHCHLPLVQAGGLLIAITGQGKTLGHVALVTFDSTMSQHLAYVQPHNPDIYPAFVFQYLTNQYHDLRRIGFSGGSTKGALTCSDLRNYFIPLPQSVEEQSEIAQAIQKLDNKLTYHRSAIASLKNLFTSILHILMTGDIRVNDLDIETKEIGAEV